MSPRVATDLAGGPIALHGLRAPSEAVSKLSPRAGGVVDLLAGSTERLLGLERALRGFDVAQVLELSMPFSQQAIEARDRGAVKRVVVTVMENIAYPPQANSLVRARARAIAGGADHFLAITERARLHLQLAGVPDDRITVLPLGTDTERFAPPPAGTPEHHGPLRVLSVSRLEPGKGVEDLALAIGLLGRRGVDAEVTFVGDGPSRPAIERIAVDLHATERIHFHGPVAWEQLHEVHRRHDVFVLASAPTRNWREQFGFAVIEAMSSGLPVLVGDSGSLMEVAGREDCLVRPHDPISLADRLGELAVRPDERRALAAFSRERALEHFDQRTIRARLRDVYDAVLDRRVRTEA